MEIIYKRLTLAANEEFAEYVDGYFLSWCDNCKLVMTAEEMSEHVFPAHVIVEENKGTGKTLFKIDVKEVYSEIFDVFADTREDAIMQVKQRLESGPEGELVYEYTLEEEYWDTYNLSDKEGEIDNE